MGKLNLLKSHALDADKQPLLSLGKEPFRVSADLKIQWKGSPMVRKQIIIVAVVEAAVVEAYF